MAPPDGERRHMARNAIVNIAKNENVVWNVIVHGDRNLKVAVNFRVAPSTGRGITIKLVSKSGQEKKELEFVEFDRFRERSLRRHSLK